jgi:hypothetical protein
MAAGINVFLAWFRLINMFLNKAKNNRFSYNLWSDVWYKKLVSFVKDKQTTRINFNSATA